MNTLSVLGIKERFTDDLRNDPINVCHIDFQIVYAMTNTEFRTGMLYVVRCRKGNIAEVKGTLEMGNGTTRGDGQIVALLCTVDNKISFQKWMSTETRWTRRIKFEHCLHADFSSGLF